MHLAQIQWRTHGRNFFIDKQPPNWLLAAAIHLALPQARILNLVRDPMDTCFSNWRAYFGDACAYSYNLGALAEYFNDHRRVMTHWHRIMPGDPRRPLRRPGAQPEATLRRVFTFCGLEWEPGSVDLSRNTAPSATLNAARCDRRCTTGLSASGGDTKASWSLRANRFFANPTGQPCRSALSRGPASDELSIRSVLAMGCAPFPGHNPCPGN